MNKLEHISFKDKKAIFDRLEQVASQANLSQAEGEKFETEWKIYNDYFNTIESAEKKAAAEAREKALEEGFDEGFQEGRTEGREKGLAEGREIGLAEGREVQNIENARNLKHLGVSVEIIMQATGLSIEEMEKI